MSLRRVSNGMGQCNKGTTGKGKNLAKGRDGTAKIRDGAGRWTNWDRAEKDVLKQENDLLKAYRKGKGQKNCLGCHIRNLHILCWKSTNGKRGQ